MNLARLGVSEEPLAIPMSSAAQVTEAELEADQNPAVDQTLVERLRELLNGGISQNEAARQLGVPECTARRWLKS